MNKKDLEQSKVRNSHQPHEHKPGANPALMVTLPIVRPLLISLAPSLPRRSNHTQPFGSSLLGSVSCPGCTSASAPSLWLVTFGALTFGLQLKGDFLQKASLAPLPFPTGPEGSGLGPQSTLTSPCRPTLERAEPVPSPP